MVSKYIRYLSPNWFRNERIEHSISMQVEMLQTMIKCCLDYIFRYFENSLETDWKNIDYSRKDNIEYVSVKDYNRKMGLNLSYEDELRYEDMFQKVDRQPM